MLVAVYTTSEVRNASLDAYAAAGSRDEALAKYRSRSGKPGRFSRQFESEGCPVWVYDEDATGGTFISYNVVDVQEIIEE